MPRAHPADVEPAAPDQVGVGTILFFQASAATPLTVCSALMSTGLFVANQIALALAFVVIAVVFAVFAFGYTEMAARIPNAGAFYAYIAWGLGRPMGVGGAWVALLAYWGLEVGLFGAIGPAASALLDSWFGITVPWWSPAISAWVLATWLGLRRLRNIASFLRVLLLAEVALVVLYSVANLAHPAGGQWSWVALDPAVLLGSGAGAGLALAVLGYIGFEQSAVFSERARDTGVVRRATFVSLLFLGGLYTVSAFSTVLAAGPDAVRLAAEHKEGLLFFLAERNLGPWAAEAGLVLLVTSLFAALMAFRHACASYGFALCREGVLPRALGRENPLTRQPQNMLLLLGVLDLAVLVVAVATDMDPLEDLFIPFGTGGALGVLGLLVATSLAVFWFFTRSGNKPTGVADTVRCRVLPLVAAVAILGVLWSVIARFDVLLGVGPDDPRRWGIPTLFLILLLAGIAYGLYLRMAKPQIYLTIGRGAETAITAGAAR